MQRVFLAIRTDLHKKYDYPFQLDALDRHKALAFLSTEWVGALRLPEAHAYFGPHSVAEYQPLAEALTREFNRPDTESLIVYMTGDPREWDIAASPMRSLIHRLSSAAGKKIAVVMERGAKGAAAPENLAILQGLHDACGVTLWEGRRPVSRSGSVVLATVTSRAGSCRSFAVAEGPAVHAGPEWGSSSSSPIVVAETSKPELDNELTLTEREVNVPALMGASRIEIARELDGPANGFGARLLTLILQKFPSGNLPGAGVATSLTYEDRYLKTPTAVSLLIEFVSALKGYLSADDRWALQGVSVVICPAEGNGSQSFGPPIHVTHDWATSEARDGALTEALAYCGLEASIEVQDRRDTLHSRVLSVSFDDGRELKIWFDQGFSYWAAARGVPSYPTVFPFIAAAKDQGEVIAVPKFKVWGHPRPTQLFVTVS